MGHSLQHAKTERETDKAVVKEGTQKVVWTERETDKIVVKEGTQKAVWTER